MNTRGFAWLVAMMLQVLAGCSTLVPTPAVAPVSSETALQAWARVLDRFVNEAGEVDFSSLEAERTDLDRYVGFVARTPLSMFRDDDDKLAHMVNAYNALSMFNVIESGIPLTHAGWNKVSFFVLRKLIIGGQPMSLYTFENDVIRPLARSRADPRIHFALNCSAVSCPRLPRKPFTPVGLSSELERESREFFSRPMNFRIVDETRTVWLSEILRFYTEDFVPEPAPSLIDYANRFAPRRAPLDYAVRFVPYDWTIANTRRLR